MAMLGIMQGRLVRPIEARIQCFPVGVWDREFPAAQEAQLDCIEWIYDHFGAAENPICSDTGCDQMRALASKHGVAIRSIVADWFMDFPLVRCTANELQERRNRLRWLIRQCPKVGIERMVIPFVDASQITSAAETESVISTLLDALKPAEECRVEIHLETSLNPQTFASLLAQIDHAMLRVNYDSGNSASLGYDVHEEFAAYGHRIGSVHIKDRVLGGTTVPLGSGNTDFPGLIECLGKVDYQGDYILQVARGVPGDELAWATHNRQYVIERFGTLLKG